jgi:hypothetical protein
MALPTCTNAKLWLAILREIDHAGGSVRPSALYPKLVQYFPEITNEDLRQTRSSGENVRRNKIRWARLELVHRGLLDSTTHGL